MVDPNDSSAPAQPINPYLDALSGERPPEIAAFELNLDPYANMVPRVSQRSAGLDTAEPLEESGPRRHPWMIAISVFLVALMVVVPLMAEVFARLGL